MTKRKVGRPPFAWTTEIEEEMFTRIMKGEGILKISEDDWLPCITTIQKRLLADDEFATKYVRAKEVCMELMAAEILEIADTPLIGKKTTTKADGSVEIVTGDMVDRARLRVESRKWLMSKLAPKKYGDKQEIEHTGEIGLRALSDRQLEDRARALLEGRGGVLMIEQKKD